MKHPSNVLRATIALGLITSSYLGGCTTEASGPGDYANVSIQLESSAASGVAYRLREFGVDVAGPVSFTLRSDDYPEDAATMDGTLPVGSYSATVRDGWVLERIQDGVAVPVPAYLQTPTLGFTIQTGQTASLSFAFRTSTGPVMTGGVSVGFTVDDDPATWVADTDPTRAARAVSTDDSGNVYALFAGGSAYWVRSYSPYGEPGWEASGPLPTSAPTSADVVALPDGRVRIAWSGAGTIGIVTFDGATGAQLSSDTFPYGALGFPNSNESVLVAIGRAGLVAATTTTYSPSRLATIDEGSVLISGSPLNGLVSHLVVAGTDERIAIGTHPGGPGGSRVVLLDPFGAVLADLYGPRTRGLAADAEGNVYAARGEYSQIADLVRVDAQTHSFAWVITLSYPFTGGAIQALGAGPTGVAVLARESGGYEHLQRIAPWGTVLDQRLVPFMFSGQGETVMDAACDSVGGTILAVRRGGTMGYVGRVEP